MQTNIPKFGKQINMQTQIQNRRTTIKSKTPQQTEKTKKKLPQHNENVKKHIMNTNPTMQNTSTNANTLQKQISKHTPPRMAQSLLLLDAHCGETKWFGKVLYIY